MKKKNIYIKSKVRFTAFIAIMIISLVMGVNTLLGVNEASGESVPEYISVEVAAGDTLWTVAELYMSENMDIRERIHLIMDVNNLDSPEINAGTVIKIPKNSL